MTHFNEWFTEYDILICISTLWILIPSSWFYVFSLCLVCWDVVHYETGAKKKYDFFFLNRNQGCRLRARFRNSRLHWMMFLEIHDNIRLTNETKGWEKMFWWQNPDLRYIFIFTRVSFFFRIFHRTTKFSTVIGGRIKM